MQIRILIAEFKSLSLESIACWELGRPSWHVFIFINNGPVSLEPIRSFIIGAFQADPLRVAVRSIICRLHCKPGENRFTDSRSHHKSGRKPINPDCIEIQIFCWLVIERVGSGFRSWAVSRTGDDGITRLGDIFVRIGLAEKFHFSNLHTICGFSLHLDNRPAIMQVRNLNAKFKSLSLESIVCGEFGRPRWHVFIFVNNGPVSLEPIGSLVI